MKLNICIFFLRSYVIICYGLVRDPFSVKYVLLRLGGIPGSGKELMKLQDQAKNLRPQNSLEISRNLFVLTHPILPPLAYSNGPINELENESGRYWNT